MRDHTNCANCGKRLKDDNMMSYCDEYCAKGQSLLSGRVTVNDDEIWNGVWEDITHEPIKITGGRRELIEVCKKYNCMPKALIKPKSSGKGFEMQQRRY